MTGLEREVVTGYPFDRGRGFARLDQETIRELIISSGFAIEIEGEATTAARAWKAHTPDWGQGTIHVDRFIRHNAGVDVGTSVTVRRAEPTEADEVVFGPPRELGFEPIEPTTQQLRNRPLTVEDVVPVEGPSESPPRGFSAVVVLDTTPGGVVEVTDQTTIEFRPTVDGEDVGSGQ